MAKYNTECLYEGFYTHSCQAPILLPTSEVIQCPNRKSSINGNVGAFCFVHHFVEWEIRTKSFDNLENLYQLAIQRAQMTSDYKRGYRQRIVQRLEDRIKSSSKEPKFRFKKKYNKRLIQHIQDYEAQMKKEVPREVIGWAFVEALKYGEETLKMFSQLFGDRL
jgi:hypothetical protein